MARGITVELVHSVLSAAEQGQTRDLFALYRDMVLASSHLQTEFAKRKLAVLGDAIQFLPFDKKAQIDVDAATKVEAEISAFRGWIGACAFLLDASLYPVSVAEKLYKATDSGYSIKGLTPVPYQLLDFTSGHLMIFDVDPATGQPRGTKHEADPDRYIVHRGHLLSSPDNWGGPMRSVLFWWLLSTMGREWWAKFLDRYGAPFLLGKYSDEEGRTILERAFALATKIGGLAVSDETSVEIKQAAASDSGDAFDKFISVCNREMSKLVLGQTLSSEAQPTGLGSGTSQIQENVRQDIRKFDARLLAETMRDQLITQFCTINRLPGKPPILSWGSESEAEAKSTIAVLESLTAAGLQVSDDSLFNLSERLGLQIERRPQAAQGPFPFSTPYVFQGAQRTPRHLDAIAQAGAADLAQAFRGSLAPIARIIRESRSAEECESRIREFGISWRPERVNTLVADALGAYAANGSVPAR
jgi:phage gp29-like protein